MDQSGKVMVLIIDFCDDDDDVSVIPEEWSGIIMNITEKYTPRPPASPDNN